MRGRADIEPRDIGEFLDKGRIAGELEDPPAMGRQPMRRPVPLHRRHAEPRGRVASQRNPSTPASANRRRSIGATWNCGSATASRSLLMAGCAAC